MPAGKKRAMGMYAAVLRHQRSKRAAHLFVTTLIYASHVLQVVLGASLTALWVFLFFSSLLLVKEANMDYLEARRRARTQRSSPSSAR